MIVPDMATAPTVVVRRDGHGPGTGPPPPDLDVAVRGPEPGPGDVPSSSGPGVRLGDVANLLFGTLFRIIYPYRYFMFWMLTVVLELNFAISSSHVSILQNSVFLLFLNPGI